MADVGGIEWTYAIAHVDLPSCRIVGRQRFVVRNRIGDQVEDLR